MNRIWGAVRAGVRGGVVVGQSKPRVFPPAASSRLLRADPLASQPSQLRAIMRAREHGLHLLRKQETPISLGMQETPKIHWKIVAFPAVDLFEVPGWAMSCGYPAV